MSDWDAEITFLEPQFTERDNLGRGRRMSLRQINVSAEAVQGGRNTARTRYSLTFNVHDDGTVRLSKIERDDNGTGQIHLHTLSLAVAEAEAAVGAWIGHEDPGHLSLQRTADYLNERDDANAAPITNEYAAKCERAE